MRCIRLHAAYIIPSVLRLASPIEGFIATGASRLQYGGSSRRAANSATAVTSQHHGRATLTMGAAGKKRKKVCFQYLASRRYA